MHHFWGKVLAFERFNLTALRNQWRAILGERHSFAKMFFIYKNYWLFGGFVEHFWDFAGRFGLFFIIYWEVVDFYGSAWIVFFWIVVGCCGLFLDCCGLLWIFLDHCGPLWVVPYFSEYDPNCGILWSRISLDGINQYLRVVAWR